MFIITRMRPGHLPFGAAVFFFRNTRALWFTVCWSLLLITLLGCHTVDYHLGNRRLAVSTDKSYQIEALAVACYTNTVALKVNVISLLSPSNNLLNSPKWQVEFM